MSYRQFNILALNIAISLVLTVMAVNLGVDPFSVFGSSRLPDGPASNERFRKIEYVIDNPNHYTHLIFGSSRSGMTDPRLVEERTGQTTYNLSVFSGTPTDMKKLYAAFREISGPPKSVTIGLDAMAFLSEPDRSDLSRRHHLLVDAASPLSYWLDYLLAPSFVATLDKLAARHSPDITFDWELGTYALVSKDRDIDADHQQYIADTFGKWSPPQFQAELDVLEWQEFRQWLSLLNVDGVKVTVFLQPMHHQWHARMQPLMPSLWPLLEQVPGLIDLSEFGSSDDALWYEQRHYRPELAVQIIDRLYGTVAHSR